jgi:hypothetical protein
MATLAQFVSATNASSATQTATVTATQAGDFIVVAGCHVGTSNLTSLTTNKGDTGVFQKINGNMTPLSDASFGVTVKYYVSIIAATAGTTTITATYSATPTSNDWGVWVVRGFSAFSLDKSVGLANGTVTIALSSSSGTLSAASEFVMGFNISANNSSSVNTAQTGSSGFVQDGITGNGSGFSHQITSATTAVQSAWNQVSGKAIGICSTFSGTASAPPGQINYSATDALGVTVTGSTTATISSGGGNAMLATRPFVSSSLWNTAIPTTGATYTNINWPATTGFNYSVAWPSGGPGIYFASASDPALAVTVPATWGWPGGVINTHLPSGITSATGSDHEILIVDVDGDTIHNFWNFVRQDDNHATAGAYGAASYSTGTGFGTSSPFKGVGITAIGSNEWGGLICAAQIAASGGVINHALHIVTDGAITLQGFVAPAISSDGSQTSGSGGVVVEGWRVAIPRTTTMPSGLSTLGQQIFVAMQNYGAYITDVAGGVTNLRVNINDFDDPTMTAVWHDMNQIMPLSKRCTF